MSPAIRRPVGSITWRGQLSRVIGNPAADGFRLHGEVPSRELSCPGTLGAGVEKVLDESGGFGALMRLPSPVSKPLLRVSPWLLPIAAVAAMVELIGGGWDIQWHIRHVPEFFWTPPHIVLYSGAGVVVLATGAAFLLRWAGRSYPRSVRTGATIAFTGAVLQFAAGGFHSRWDAASRAERPPRPPRW